MASAFKYQVIKGGKVCAEATTKAEATAEAARCGGKVKAKRSRKAFARELASHRNPSPQVHSKAAEQDLGIARTLLSGMMRPELTRSARQRLAVDAMCAASKAYREATYAGGSEGGFSKQIREAAELYDQASAIFRELVPNPRQVEITVPTAAEAGEFVGKYGKKAFRGLVSAGRGLASFVRSARTSAEANPASKRKRNPSGLELANTILRQLGGSARLRAMLGPKFSPLYGDNQLRFSYPGKPAARHGNKVVITYNRGTDLYDVKFYNQKGAASGYATDTVAEYSDIYADQLKPLFERQTGLYLSL